MTGRLRELAVLMSIGLSACARAELPASTADAASSSRSQTAVAGPRPILERKGPRGEPPLPCDADCMRHAEQLTDPNGAPGDHVKASLFAFFGDLEGGYNIPRLPVAEQVWLSLLLSNPVSEVTDGELLLSGCRPRVCGDDAALIVRPDGTVLAAAKISLRVRYAGPADRRIIRDDHPVLTTFVRPGSDIERYEAAFTQWALTYGLPIYRREQVVVPAPSR